MNALTIYLAFPGNCREAVTFYAQCLQAELTLTTFGDMPAMLPPDATDAVKNQVLHAVVSNGAATLMASDAMPGQPLTPGTNFSVSVHPANLEELDRVWAALSQGANITQELNDAPWGARFGMLTDKFGIPWMFNFEYPK
jgi:PhnB protein